MAERIKQTVKNVEYGFWEWGARVSESDLKIDNSNPNRSKHTSTSYWKKIRKLKCVEGLF